MTQQRQQPANTMSRRRFVELLIAAGVVSTGTIALGGCSSDGAASSSSAASSSTAQSASNIVIDAK